MKTFVTELAFLFVWISALLIERVLLTGGNRAKFCSLPKGMMYSSIAHLELLPMNNNIAYSPCTCRQTVEHEVSSTCSSS